MKGKVFLRTLRKGNWRFAWFLIRGTTYGLTHRYCFLCHQWKGLTVHRHCPSCQLDNLRRALAEDDLSVDSMPNK